MPNYFQPINPYTPFQNQFQYQIPQPIYQNPTNSNSQSNGITWVQGESGAKSYNVGPGQNVLLMDSEANTFYIKSSDSSGMPLPLRIFDYTERTIGQQTLTQEPTIDLKNYVTHEEFEKFKNEILNKRNMQNIKSNKEGT